MSIKISDLPTATTFSGADLVPIVQGGETKRIAANASWTVGNLSYTGTLTGGTGVVNFGSGQVVKDAAGNVGIGTSSPGALLDVAGSFQCNGAGTITGNWTFSGTSVFSGRLNTSRLNGSVLVSVAEDQTAVVEYELPEAFNGLLIVTYTARRALVGGRSVFSSKYVFRGRDVTNENAQVNDTGMEERLSNGEQTLSITADGSRVKIEKGAGPGINTGFMSVQFITGMALPEPTITVT